MFYLDVAYIFTLIFKCFYVIFSSVSNACFKCFIYLQTYVASVVSGCFKSGSGPSLLAFSCLASVSPSPPGAGWASAPPLFLDDSDVQDGIGPTWARETARETTAGAGASPFYINLIESSDFSSLLNYHVRLC
jgi:hypothetical protein